MANQNNSKGSTEVKGHPEFPAPDTITNKNQTLGKEVKYGDRPMSYKGTKYTSGY